MMNNQKPDGKSAPEDSRKQADQQQKPVSSSPQPPPLPPPLHELPTSPSFNIKDITELYHLHTSKEMGTGAFSRVIQATHKATGKRRAVKVMAKGDLKKNARLEQMVAHEKEILRRTHHPNIVGLHEVVTTDTTIYMVLDLMRCDLYQVLFHRGKGLRESMAQSFIAQLVMAVSYLHDNSVIHRDIKPENILISNDGKTIKLADFGLAKFMMDWDVKSTPCGTSFYIAPEIIRGVEAQGAKPMCTNKEVVKYVDMWSVGIVTYVVLTGRAPFQGGGLRTPMERKKLLKQVDELELSDSQGWRGISEEAKNFVRRCLTQEIRPVRKPHKEGEPVRGAGHSAIAAMRDAKQSKDAKPADEDDDNDDENVPPYRMSAREAMKHPWIASIVAPLEAERLKKEEEEAEKRKQTIAEQIAQLRQSEAERLEAQKKAEEEEEMENNSNEASKSMGVGALDLSKLDDGEAGGDAQSPVPPPPPNNSPLSAEQLNELQEAGRGGIDEDGDDVSQYQTPLVIHMAPPEKIQMKAPRSRTPTPQQHSLSPPGKELSPRGNKEPVPNLE